MQLLAKESLEISFARVKVEHSLKFHLVSGKINIYCDESCHLENDRQRFMVLGGVWCPAERVKEINASLREMRIRHDVSVHREIKWGAVSSSKVDFYIDLTRFFLQEKDLHFRAVVADKECLLHEAFHQTHGEWYYKMYFIMLKQLVTDRSQEYRIYLDTKDTQSASRVAKLHAYLCNNIYDFCKEVVPHVQALRSHEVQLIQLADFLSGAVSYVARNLKANAAKVAVARELIQGTGRRIDEMTWLSETKFNILRWTGRENA